MILTISIIWGLGDMVAKQLSGCSISTGCHPPDIINTIVLVLTIFIIIRYTTPIVDYLSNYLNKGCKL